MQNLSLASLSRLLHAAGNPSARVHVGGHAVRSWGELELDAGALAADRIANLRGQSVVLAPVDPYRAAAALLQLDGVVRRLVLYPPDIAREHIPYVADTAGADAILTDQPAEEALDARVVSMHSAGRSVATHAAEWNRDSSCQTEWVLLTSGTTGRPKLVVHTLASLAGAIQTGSPAPAATTWSTFYDIRRYGGLQIFLRAALTGTSLVLRGADESIADFLTRAGAGGVTHISGTPSHWRQALMSPAAGQIAPGYVRLSGEIADQGILNQLHAHYPQARMVHAFASTEAGVAFEVDDGRMGIPPERIGGTPNVELKVEEGTLRVRSSRTARCYLGGTAQSLRDQDGYVDTGDVLELRDGRYYYMGRRDGTINVGGMKVHPEEVEAVINRHPAVGNSLVWPKKNPITGALVVADVVLKTPPLADGGSQRLQQEILRFCRGELALHKVPAAIHFVPMLAVADSGKMLRRHA
jgi:acyl-coenzyme A synthetase/AMP-(fatty) acid ligase